MTTFKTMDMCPKCGSYLSLSKEHFWCNRCKEEINSNDVITGEYVNE